MVIGWREKRSSRTLGAIRFAVAAGTFGLPVAGAVEGAR